MELLTPDLGLFVWTLIIFLIVLFLLSKLAWKPITYALKNRENSIDEALNEARKAREEMANLKSENEKLIQDAKAERDQILKEAKETRDKIVSEARNTARQEGQRILEEVRDSIQKEKENAFRDLKAQVAGIALEIAAKILKTELSDRDKQERLVEEYLKDTNLN